MRKMYQSIVVLVFLTFIATSVNAQKLFFKDASNAKINAAPAEQRVITPQRARISELNIVEINEFLKNLPTEFKIENRKAAPVLSLPMPDGTIAQFNVWESIIMEEGLANKFPEIRTFGGQGITDPAAIIRFSMDPYFGFHAQIFSPNGDVYIDPYARGNVDFYQSYYTSEHIKPSTFTCLVEDTYDVPVNNATSAGPCRGTQLFTYRLAIACTGEYARAATGLTNPTVAQTLARIVTTANRVTGVYEKEISVRLILVANNDLIVFTDPVTDPFNGNDNAGVLIGESQTQITNRIGTGNFDIGHTFSTGGGGLAGLGVVCVPGQKAAGITGSNQPTGDAYDIDYVAHEMGHQFGANHSFNSTTSGCMGNRSSSAAYEVGSGTTMMGYASLCGSDNIQNRSDPYFHSISYDQIANFITTGSGGNCRIAINTGNTLPVIAGLTNNGVSIPANTPFTLSGSASDADGDALTYSWEQWNLGASTAWNGGNANTLSPLFKARIPKIVGERSFPDIAVIRANFPLNPPAAMGGLKGETMANGNRNMRFRLTVRDNRAGGGGIVSAGDGCQISAVYQISVVAGPSFAVTVPNGGESYPGGSIQTITWNTANTNAAPINTPNVRITLSVDGGLTYPHVVTNSTPNDGTEDLAIPAVAANSTSRIKIEGIDNIFYDISNANFSITAAVNPTFEFGNPATVAVTCGSATPASVSLTSSALAGFNTPINLTSSGAPAGTSVGFSVNPLTPGSAVTVTLNNANTLANGTYNITVTGTAGAIVKTRNISFVVSGGTAPTITSQPASISGCIGGTATFTSAATGATSYQWQVSVNGGANFTNIAGATSASYTIPTLLVAQNGYIYRVVVANACSSVNSNNATLTVQSNPVITTQPTSASGCAGGSANFSVVTATTSTYQWQTSTNNGVTWVNVPAATASTLTVNSLTTAMSGTQYRVITTNTCGNTTSSAATLTVSSAAAIITHPTAVAVCTGNDATFTVVATGATTYQWQVSTDGTSWSNIAGATSASYTITGATAALNGNSYRVIIASCPASINSLPAVLTVTASASITTQPTSASGCAGGSADFTVAVSATSTYQWQSSTDNGATWMNVAGATNATLTVSALTTAMSGTQYRVVVTHPCGNITSNAATLTVGSTGAITTQPTAVSTCEGANATFTVVATGTTSYQWQVSTDGTTWTNIAGANATSYTINTVTAAMDGNSYRVVIGSCPAAINSNAATLNVDASATITTQPSNVDGCDGGSANFTVVVSATSTYQWQSSTDNGATWTNVAGATNATLTVNNITTAMSGTQYRVVVSHPCGNLTSSVATLTVGSTAAITSQPTAVTVCAGDDVTYTVVATGTTSYQWQVSTDGTTWTNIAGANAASYTVSAVTAGLDGNSYRVVIGSCPTAINSNAATLTVTAATNITTQPSLSAICVDEDASLSVTAANATGYQWQVSIDGGTTWNDIAGATNSSTTLTGVDATMNNNQYRVVVEGACGDVNSNAVTLTVNAAPTVVANGPTTACSGSSITLFGSGATSYTWDNGVTDDQAFTINNTTTFTVTGTEAGCTNTATITVTVTPSPVVTISASATEIPAGGSVTLTATSNPAAAAFVWMKGGIVVPGATGNTLVVTEGEVGTYTASAEVGGCNGTSNAITLTVLPANFAFITPNPNDGNFQVRVRNTQTGTVTREVMVFDRKGARVYAEVFISQRAGDIDVMDIQLPNVANGAYALTLYENGVVVKSALVYVNK